MKIVYKSNKPNISQYFNLFNNTGWNKIYNVTQKELKSALNRTWYCVSAYCNDSLVGFGRMLSDGCLYSLVCDMIVDKTYRNKGIGSAILVKLIEYCKKNKIRAIWLFSATGKRAFYEKRGFVSRSAEGPGMYYKI